jgi:hypothetical protein
VFSVELDCAGTRDNTSWLIQNDLDATYGLRSLTVVGECAVIVVAFDANMTPLADLRIEPAQSAVGEWIPPAGTARVGAVCADDCTGTGKTLLEYDTPMVA